MVAYNGCEMKLLSRCRAVGTYDYAAVTPKRDTLRIKDEDALWANMPLGAAKLEATLSRKGQLTVAMTMVGRYLFDEPVDRATLKGTCAGATHFVAGLTVGAFELAAGGEVEVGAGGEVAGLVGVGGKSRALREVLTQDGDDAACNKASSSDTSPPDRCGAVLRVQVVPLLGKEPAAAPEEGTPRTTPDVLPKPKGKLAGYELIDLQPQMQTTFEGSHFTIQGESVGEWRNEGFTVPVNQELVGDVAVDLRFKLGTFPGALVMVQVQTDVSTALVFVQYGDGMEPQHHLYVVRDKQLGSGTKLLSGNVSRKLFGDERSQFHTMGVRFGKDGRTVSYVVDDVPFATYLAGTQATRVKAVLVAFQSGSTGYHRADFEYLWIRVPRRGSGDWTWP